jgi:hypothetical protein
MMEKVSVKGRYLRSLPVLLNTKAKKWFTRFRCRVELQKYLINGRVI